MRLTRAHPIVDDDVEHLELDPDNGSHTHQTKIMRSLQRRRLLLAAGSIALCILVLTANQSQPPPSQLHDMLSVSLQPPGVPVPAPRPQSRPPRPAPLMPLSSSPSLPPTPPPSLLIVPPPCYPPPPSPLPPPSLPPSLSPSPPPPLWPPPAQPPGTPRVDYGGPARYTPTGTRSVTIGRASGRPALLRVPGGHEHRRPLPLVIGLHANGDEGSDMEARFGEAVRDGMSSAVLSIFPDGTFDAARGGRFWDATGACCRFGAARPIPDDVSWLSALISEAVDSYGADADGVIVFGLSNGGFMAHRMACASTRPLRAIVALSSATHLDFARRCQGAAANPSVLHAHAYNDNTVPYHGGPAPFLGTGVVIPSALTTVRDWVDRLGCNPSATFSSGETMGLGAVTDVLDYRACRGGRKVVHWAFHSASHGMEFLDVRAFVEHAIVGFGLRGFVRDSDGDGYRDDVDARPFDSGRW